MQQKYFAASNSSAGFKSYYEEVFADADFVYIIKGGPGTGKSSFMKKYASLAQSEGREVEYYYCSSDPTSLDGVLIHGDGGSIGILDGTAPHVSEPNFPGAREEMVNLGSCWNGEILRKQKNEIIALCEKKSSEYKCAYTFLRSVGNLRAVSDSLISSAICTSKLRSAARRLVRDLPDGELEYTPAILDSVSMNGQIRFDSFEKNAEKVYIISEFYGVGELFLDELFKILKMKAVKARVSFDPICCEHVDGIFLERERLAFVCGRGLYESQEDAVGESISEPSRSPARINSKRFVDMCKLREIRSELRYTSRLAQSSLDGALHALSKAKIYHFLLEDIYGKAMDWNKFESLSIKI